MVLLQQISLYSGILQHFEVAILILPASAKSQINLQQTLMWPMNHLSWVTSTIMAQTGKHLLISSLTLYICYQSLVFLEAGFPCTHTKMLTSISFIQFTTKPLINAVRAKLEEGWSVQTAAGFHQLKTKLLDNTEKVKAYNTYFKDYLSVSATESTFTCTTLICNFVWVGEREWVQWFHLF